MKEYLTTGNLKKAIMLGGFVSLLAMPRIVVYGKDVGGTLALAVFPLMVLVAGAVTAWGQSAGMAGAFPENDNSRIWTRRAIFAGAVISGMLFAFDQEAKQALMVVSTPQELRLAYPPTLTEAFALMLWSAGFETVFFYASTMSVLARITRRVAPGILVAVCLRLTVLSLQYSASGVLTIDRVVSVAVVSGLAAYLFARGGLASAMALSAIVNARHIVHVLLAR